MVDPREDRGLSRLGSLSPATTAVADVRLPSAGRSAKSTAVLLFGLVASLAPLLTFATTLQEIAADWDLSAGQSGWIGGIYFAGYAMAVPLLGSAADRIDGRRLYIASSVLGAAASLAFAAWAHGFLLALILRFVGGVAFAGIHMPGLKLLVDRVAPAQQPRAAALYTSSYAVGSAGSLLIAGVVDAAFGWRATFVAAGIGPVLAMAALAFLPAAPPRRAPTARILEFRPLLRNRALMAYVAGFAGNTWEVFAVRVWFVAYLGWTLSLPGNHLRLPPLGVVAGLASLAGLPVSIAMAELALRHGRERTIVATCVVSVLVCLALAATAGGPSGIVIALLVLVQITSFADVGALAGGAVSAADPERRGAALAIYALAGYATGFFGPVAVGVVLDRFGGAASIAGWRAAFVTIALGSAVAACAIRRAPAGDASRPSAERTAGVDSRAPKRQDENARAGRSSTTAAVWEADVAKASLQHQNALLTGQNRVLEMVATGAPLAETLTQLTRFIEAQEEGSRCGLLIVSDDGQHFRRGIGPSLPEAYHLALDGVPIAPPYQGPCGRAAHRGEAVVVPDIANDPRWADEWRNLVLSCGLMACRSTPVFAADGTVLASFAMYYDQPRDPHPAQPGVIQTATHLAGIALDRGRAQARDSEEQFRTLAESIPQLAWMARADGSIFWYNRRWYDYTGTTLDQMRGWGWRAVHHPDHVQRVVERIQLSWDSGEPWEDTFPLRGKDGRYRWFLSRALPVRDGQGRVARWFGTNTDVTDQREAEEKLRRLAETLEERVAERTRQLTAEVAEREKAEAAFRQAQKMEAVGQLTGGIAHDFNNLLTVIAGNLDLMQKWAGSDTAVRRLVDAALHAAERGARLTQQLLAFSRRQALRPEIVDLGNAIVECEGMLRRAAGEAIEVAVAADPHLWLCRIDSAQFENSLLNLAVNARDAMPAGGRLTICARNLGVNDPGAGEASAGSPPGSHILVSVADTGEGIAPELLERVFEPFFTTKEPGKGTGLGLSQVYGFVEQSGGHVRIESTPGAGTTVLIYLPTASGGAVEDRDPDDRGAPPSKGSETILVVEDDPDVLEVTVATLEALGYRVLTAQNGPAALALLERDESISVLFTDLMMPMGMSGGDLAERARRIRPQLGILLASGYADQLSSMEAAADLPILNKPYRPGELANNIRAVLAGGDRNRPSAW